DNPVQRVKVAHAMVALPLQAAGDVDTVGAVGEGRQQVQRRDAPGAGDHDGADRRRQRGARIARGVGGAVRARAAEEGDDVALAVRSVRDDLGDGDLRRRDLWHAGLGGGDGRRVHTVASARSSASEKPPTVIAPDGHSAAQMPQPRQLAWSTSACALSPSTRRTAPWGQTLTQTPQPMHRPGSEKATSTGVAAIPPWSIEVTRAAAALACAMVSGMPLGPWAVPAMKIPARCESTGRSLGWYSLRKPAAPCCRPTTLAIWVVPADASRPA